MPYYKRLASGKLARRTDGKRAKSCSATSCNDPWVKWFLGAGPPGNIGKAVSVSLDAAWTNATVCGQLTALFDLVSYGSLFKRLDPDANIYQSGIINYCGGALPRRYFATVSAAPSTVGGKPCVDITSSIQMSGQFVSTHHSNGIACCLAGGGACSVANFTSTPFTLSASSCDPVTGLFVHTFQSNGLFQFLNSTPSFPFPQYCSDFAPGQLVQYPTSIFLEYSIVPAWEFP